jgi:transcription-repair coupling factor (superfamily II helicase)
MYNDMLNEAIRALKNGEIPDLDAPFTAGCEVNLHAPALLPTEYCPDINARLALYKRLSNCTEIDALIQIQEELVDRFGKLPDAARVLLSTHRLRLDAMPLGIQKIDATDVQVLIQFKSNSLVDPATLIELMQTQKNMRFAGPDRLRIDMAATDIKERTDAIRALLRRLQPAKALLEETPL